MGVRTFKFERVELALDFKGKLFLDTLYTYVRQMYCFGKSHSMLFGRILTCIIYILYVGRDFDDNRRHFSQNLPASSHNEHDNDHECYISQSNEKF